MSNVITRIETATLEGHRPRPAGSNARLGVHGDLVRMPVARVTTADGATGFGRCRVDEHQARVLIGESVEALVDGGLVRAGWHAFEYPLLDLAATLAGQPVWALVAGAGANPREVTSYDTSLYFDDLHLDDDAAAAELVAGYARDGWERGHRAVKIKVGRGARHMPLEAGTQRDIAIIRAVREALGPEARIAIDANDGWNLNLTKQVLAETADASLYWLEEAFHEDAVLYDDLREWRSREGLDVLIADGEGAAHPALLDWARAGSVEVVQYDIYSYGFSRWIGLAREMAAVPVLVSPHSYGGGIGAYVVAHLAATVDNVPMVEWDEVIFDAIDASGWAIENGIVTIPSTPGWGLTLDDTAFAAAVRDTGITIG